MNQRRALGHSASVAILVFVILALPVLRDIYLNSTRESRPSGRA